MNRLYRIGFSLMLIWSLVLTVATVIHGETLLIVVALSGVAMFAAALVLLVKEERCQTFR